MTDTELKVAMADAKRWPSIVASFRNGHAESADLVLRAQTLFAAGAPCVDPESRKTVSATSAPPKTSKSAPVRVEKNMRSIKVDTLGELFNAIERGIPKDMKVYMPRDGEYVEVDLDAAERLLLNMAGRVEDATVEALYSPGKFPTRTVPSAGDGHGEPINAVPKPYDMLHPTVTRLPGGTFVMANVDPGIATPLDFSAPEPGDNPATGEPVGDLTKGSPVFKMAAQHGVPKGLFANIVKPEGTEPEPQTFGR